MREKSHGECCLAGCAPRTRLCPHPPSPSVSQHPILYAETAAQLKWIGFTNASSWEWYSNYLFKKNKNVWAELKITTLSGMFAKMNGCRFAWEKHRLITGCFHTPKCWSVCWWSWSSRLHRSLAGPQIPQVNTPAAESCGCLGCPARGDLSKHEQTMRKRRRDAHTINQSPGGNVKVDCRTRLCVSVGKKQNKRILQSTIVSSSPGEYFSLIGHSQNVGSAAWDLDQFVPEERLNYFGLGAKSHREVCYWI